MARYSDGCARRRRLRGARGLAARSEGAGAWGGAGSTSPIRTSSSALMASRFSLQAARR
jgi:hypothetical protein